MNEIKITVEGRVYTGHFVVQGRHIIVGCHLGRIRTVIGLSRPGRMARQLLVVLVQRKTINGVLPANNEPKKRSSKAAPVVTGAFVPKRIGADRVIHAV